MWSPQSKRSAQIAGSRFRCGRRGLRLKGGGHGLLSLWDPTQQDPKPRPEAQSVSEMKRSDSLLVSRHFEMALNYLVLLARAHAVLDHRRSRLFSFHCSAPK